jgi:hypothetical protein
MINIVIDIHEKESTFLFYQTVHEPFQFKVNEHSCRMNLALISVATPPNLTTSSNSVISTGMAMILQCNIHIHLVLARFFFFVHGYDGLLPFSRAPFFS